MKRTSFEIRRDKARKIASYGMAKITSRDYKDFAKTVVVPGSNSKQYEVILKRDNRNSIIQTECRLIVAGGHGYQNCPGNSKAVCYHSMIAVLTAAEENGVEANICKNPQDAERLARLGERKIYKIKSKFNDMAIFLVAKISQDDPEKKKPVEALIMELGYEDRMTEEEKRRAK